MVAMQQVGGFALQSGRKEMRADAPAFHPPTPTVGSLLSQEQKSMLRGGYHTESGEWQPYLLGRLKTYNKRQGYGFIECPEAFTLYACDVFVHKNEVPSWCQLGQVVEFTVHLNGRWQPQAKDVVFYAHLNVNRFLAPSPPPPPKPTVEVPPKLEDEDHPILVLREGARGDQKRYLGRLKSFAPDKYGFILGEGLTKNGEDIFFDKSQVQGQFQPNQIVEFTLHYNRTGHPQAREINWTPIPVLPGNQLNPSEKLVKDLQGILDNLAAAEFGQAVDSVYRLMKQGEVVDFVSFLLVRLGIPRVSELSSTNQVMLLLVMSLNLESISVDSRALFVKWLSALFTELEGARERSKNAASPPSDKMSQEEISKAFKAIVMRISKLFSSGKVKMPPEEETQWERLMMRAKVMSE